jgi:serine phosphatase RsbU (regulator of sigma subunit)
VEVGRFKKAVDAIGSIGTDPGDSEQTRLLKKIWGVTISLAFPISLVVASVYLILGQNLPAAYWLIQALIWFGSLFLFAVIRKNIESIAFSSQLILVLGSFAITCLRGGFFGSDGFIFMGVMGVLYAMVFPNRGRAVFLFILYIGLLSVLIVLELTVFRADTSRPPASTLLFWITFAAIAVFAVFAIYYFVGQRDLNFRLLQAEKERSDGLLRRIEKDLETAAKIQRAFLPRQVPRVEHFDCSGSNISCYEVGGDYYDFVPVDPYRLGIAVGDVSGKGIGASLLMASLRAAFRSEIHPGYRIEDMAAKINDFVYNSSAISSFITFFYCDVDRNSEDVHYVNAGHNPPFLLRAGGTLEYLSSTGFCLGMFAGASFEQKTVRLGPGDVLVIYTDGIPDSRNADGAEYGLDRLVSLLRGHTLESAAAMSAAVVGDVRQFMGQARQFDDQTLVIIKRT